MKNIKILIKTFCLLFILISISTLILFCPFQAYAKDPVPVLRLSGADRYQTAVAISMEGWKTSQYIVLASGDGDDKFADALAGSPISYTLNAPILLTATNELSVSTKGEIIRLNAKNAILLGGTGVISDNVEIQLKSMGIQVERLWGQDRYDTSVKIAEKVRSTKPFSKIFLTSGEEFQYAMMIAPFASKNSIPILFLQKSSLNGLVADAITKWGIFEADIIGNTNIISQSVEDSLKNMGLKVNRVYGSNISETNINIINTYKMDTSHVAVARDDIFADGLAGAPLAAIKNMPIILTGQASTNPDISDFLSKCSLEYAYVLGGVGGVSDYIIPLIRKGIQDSKVLGNTSGNINRGGLATSKDEWIYYQNAGQGGKLYKIKTDGTGSTAVCSDTPFYINVVQDWIYYTNAADSSKIYKIRTDGTCRTKLNNDESCNTTVIDNWIYYINYSDSGRLYKIAIDGSCKTKLNDNNSKYLNVKWDFIYYVNADDGYSINRIKPDNPSTTEQLKNVYAGDMSITNEFIYFSNKKDSNSLYKININGTGLAKLCTDTAYDLQVTGDWIYYSNASNGDKLCKIKTDGTSKTILYDGSAYLLYIVGDWIYFLHDKQGLTIYKIKNDGTSLEESYGIQIKNYMQIAIEAQNAKDINTADEGKIEWIEVTAPKPIPMEADGIPVKYAFNNLDKKVAFLTFDDGPSKNITPLVLDILKKSDIKATFFIVGRMAKNNGEILKRISSEGHTIGNHSYSHEYGYLYRNLKNFLGEINDCDSILKSILGDSFLSKIFRFPGGSFGDGYSSYKAALKEHGYEYINWNVSIGDSAGNNVPVKTLIENLKQTCSGKSHIVVLMHDLGSKITTADALPIIIEYLKSQGYEFKRLI